MFTAFSTALSALTADSAAIDVVGNNLANLNTTGFKASEVQFHDLISQQIGTLTQSNQIGMGVGQIDAIQQFSQGAVQVTSGATDAAIQGNGFFEVKNQSNQTLYTRDGSFQLDSSGNLITDTGEKVQGWTAVNGVLNPNGAVSNITLPLGAVIPAKATTTVTASVNLDAESPINTATAPAVTPGSTFSAPIQVFDSQGSAHTLNVTYSKTAANSWSVSVTIPSADVGGLATDPPTVVGTGTLTFDANGNLPLPAPVPPTTIPITITGLVDGATIGDATGAVNLNLYNSAGNSAVTQYAQASGVSGTQQDGFAAGQVTQIAIQDNGLIVANYSNGLQTTVAQLALANISNPDTLASVGNNNLQATAQTAAVTVGASGSSGLGQIVGGALESSNADIATEFTNLLSFQRSYQAASRVITTEDQLLQETVNLIHP
jgi:flagellar hook protein FlgE